MKYTVAQLACLRLELTILERKMTLMEVRRALEMYGIKTRPGFHLANDLIISGCIMEDNGRLLVSVPKEEV